MLTFTFTVMVFLFECPKLTKTQSPTSTLCSSEGVWQNSTDFLYIYTDFSLRALLLGQRTRCAPQQGGICLQWWLLQIVSKLTKYLIAHLAHAMETSEWLYTCLQWIMFHMHWQASNAVAWFNVLSSCRDLTGKGIAALSSNVFQGMSELVELWVWYPVTIPAVSPTSICRYNEQVIGSGTIHDSSLKQKPDLHLAVCSDLKHNAIKSVPAGTFSGLTNLDMLDLTGNQIAFLPADAFVGMPNLVGL